MNLDVTAAFAREAHKNQLDKSGFNYFTHHVKPVSYAVLPNGVSYSVVGLLHDVVEDCEISLSYLSEELGLDDAEYDAIDILTRDNSSTYKEYINNVKRSNIACAVKYADLMSNMSSLRPGAGISSSLMKRYISAAKELRNYCSSQEIEYRISSYYRGAPCPF